MTRPFTTSPRAGRVSLDRLAGHPYARLARNRPFAAFWASQAVSLLGDRLHQVALAVLVYGASGSALLTGLVVAAGLLPNLVVGPFAGVAVDRMDRRHVLIVSDLVRAGLVLLIPPAAALHPALTIPVVVAITSASLFFRPAKQAVVPDLVEDDELGAANASTGVAEGAAGIAGGVGGVAGVTVSTPFA